MIVPEPTPLYKSCNTAFVATLLASDRATYVGCEIDPSTKRVMFVVTDIAEMCRTWEEQFSKHVCPLVHPRVLLEARSYLQSEVAKIKPGGRHE